MSRLTADFSAAFSRDLKKKAKRRNWDLAELQKLIDLVLENTPRVAGDSQAPPQHALPER